MLWLANTAFSFSINLKKTQIAKPVQRTPKIVALTMLLKVNFAMDKFIELSWIEILTNIIIKQITVATAMDEKASSSDDLFFNVFTQFAEKA